MRLALHLGRLQQRNCLNLDTIGSKPGRKTLDNQKTLPKESAWLKPIVCRRTPLHLVVIMLYLPALNSKKLGTNPRGRKRKHNKASCQL
jgi:hypothetical protein